MRLDFLAAALIALVCVCLFFFFLILVCCCCWDMPILAAVCYWFLYTYLFFRQCWDMFMCCYFIYDTRISSTTHLSHSVWRPTNTNCEYFMNGKSSLRVSSLFFWFDFQLILFLIFFMLLMLCVRKQCLMLEFLNNFFLDLFFAMVFFCSCVFFFSNINKSVSVAIKLAISFKMWKNVGVKKFQVEYSCAHLFII